MAKGTNVSNLPAAAILALEELAKRSSQLPQAGPLMAGLFPQQCNLINDPNTFKVAVCSRQAGKSYTASTYLLKTCMEEADSDCAYIALTRQSGKRIIWRALKKKVRDLGKAGQGVTFNESELTVSFPNGSTINLFGANDTATIENLRGTPWKLIIIDEAASYRSDLDYAMDEVVIPALITKKGTLLLIGTPSSDFNSYFYRAYHTLPEFTKHHWTIMDNTSIPHAKEWIETLKKRKGWSDNNPVLLREYFGMFIRSSENQVYSGYSPSKHLIDSLPASILSWHYALGVDIGFKDYNAIVVLAFNPQITDKVFVVEQWKKNKMNVTQLGQAIKGFSDRYNPVAIVMDHGGLGVMISEEISNRFGLNITAAKKTDKVGHIELVNAAFESNTLLIVGGMESALSTELLNLSWANPEHTMEDPACENHLSDAMLYVYRLTYAWLHDAIQATKPRALSVAAQWDADDDAAEEAEARKVFFG
jgi:phage terminase large subunit